MTMNAWVTSLTVVDDEGYDLRIVDPGFDLVQGANDLVAGLSSHSTLVTGTHSFSSGEHSGFAPFVIEELDPPDIEDLAVDMTWTCGSGAATVSRDQGYILDLDDLGCGVDQKLVMRVLNGPNRIHWELYGTAHVTKVTPTVNGAGGIAMAGPRLLGWWFLGTLATGCGPGPVVEIDAGKDYVCARFERGDSACHNYDAAGGPDQWEGSWEWPSLETPEARLVSMSTQYVHLCGLDEGGSVHCTGRKEFYDPVPTGTFTEVTAGSYSTCALDPAGQAHCWGTSFYEDVKQYYKGSDMDPPPGPFRHLFPHDNGYCGLHMDGTLSCWGYNQFGTASPPEGLAFSELFPNDTVVYCGRTTSGVVHCWGYEKEAPAYESALVALSPFSEAALGWEAACVLRDAGDVSCRSLPDQDPMEYLPPAGVSFSQITAGARFFCGLTDKPVDGHRVLCWGCRWDDEGVDPALPGQCVPPPW